MFEKFKKLLGFVTETIPYLEKGLPVAEAIAGLTPVPWDDVLVKGLKAATEKAKQFLGDDGVKAASTVGVQNAVVAQELGLTPEEYTKAVEDGVKLAAEAKRLKRAARQRIKAGEMVTIGDHRLRDIEEVRAVKDFEWRLAAEIKLNMEKEAARAAAAEQGA